MTTKNDQLDKLVEAVLASSKYKDVRRDLIKNIGLQELGKRSSIKEAIKATKNKLHQVGGAYLSGNEVYSKWLDSLAKISRSSNQDELLKYLVKIMSYHASTRERLPILSQFYTTILADLPPIHRVLDVACGFNPLALPWMPLTDPVEYYMCDIYGNMINFLNQFMTLMHVQGCGMVCDVIHSCPSEKVDVAFILKTIPCLEQIDKLAGFRLLHAINADYMVISFPVHSLGGRSKGMMTSYEAKFYTLVENTTWSVRQFEFSTELAFLVKKI